MSEELGPALKSARKAASVTQVAVVAATRLSQAQLSRVENGRALPTESDVLALASLYGLTLERTEQLVEMARAAADAVTDERLVVQRGSTLASQQRWRAMENESIVVRSFQPALVVGGLQTARYAATVMGVAADSPIVQERMRRQERISQTGRRLIVVQTEGALRRTVGSADVMAEQMDHLVELSRSPGLELGVIPDGTAADFVVGSGFHLYDGHAAVVGLEVAAATLTEQKDVTFFRSLFDRLSDLAAFGDEGRAVLARTKGARD